MTSLAPEQTFELPASKAFIELLAVAAVSLAPELDGQDIDPEAIKAALPRFTSSIGHLLSTQTVSTLSAVFANHTAIKLMEDAK